MGRYIKCETQTESTCYGAVNSSSEGCLGLPHCIRIRSASDKQHHSNRSTRKGEKTTLAIEEGRKRNINVHMTTGEEANT